MYNCNTVSLTPKSKSNLNTFFYDGRLQILEHAQWNGLYYYAYIVHRKYEALAL